MKLQFGVGRQEEREPLAYLEVELTSAQRDFVLDALQRHPQAGETRKRCIAAMREAREVPLPLDRLDWDELGREAERRGCDLFEAWYDLIAGRGARA